MAWTTFANLTAPTLPELDANLDILSSYINIPVTLSGTNALAMVNAGGAAAITEYSINQVFIGIAAATNTGPTTAQLGSLGALNVYVDTIDGPQALSGGEIVQNCELALSYDPTLNGGAGGFHLSTGGAEFVSQTLNPVALQVNSTTAILGLPSALHTISFGSIDPNSFSLATVTLGTVGPPEAGDLALVTFGSVQTAGIVIQAYIPAAGSVVLGAYNITSNTTVAPGTAPYRLTIARYS